ncbi:MAG: hypothetical protein CVT94_18100 [Bacteroidetes bacterium HGW-Bacteroidetes-11]|nr:MAG: hypothetical protein CVT94_18100 [Bacteroidetes bacterium HGW-Bacteroidetes-11]
MKNQTKLSLLSFLMLFSLLQLSCRKTVEDEFEDVNGDVAIKYISSIVIVSSDFEKDELISVTYDGEERVSDISYGESIHYMVYDEFDNLSMLTFDGVLSDVSEMYLAPYDILINMHSWSEKARTGDVLKYDSKGNPFQIEIFIDTYQWNWTNYYVSHTDTLLCEIQYDPNPNPLFYTLKAAGIISVLDQTELIFGSHSPEIIKARQLLPFNNIKTITFKELNGIPKTIININTSYDDDDYPEMATIVVINESGSFLHKVNYKYK